MRRIKLRVGVVGPRINWAPGDIVWAEDAIADRLVRSDQADYASEPIETAMAARPTEYIASMRVRVEKPSWQN